MATARERLQAGAPDDRKNDLMPRLVRSVVGGRPRHRSCWFEARAPVLRSPAGVFQDNRNYWDAGKPYYDPERIKVPTLVVVAEWDR